MILYHGSYMAIAEPDLRHSRKHVDFGAGFYTTKLREQAVKWSQRFIQDGREAWLSIYEFDESALKEYRFLDFPNYDEAWLDFVFACREGMEATAYDLIQGGVSNDKIFNTCELYRRKYLTKAMALERLRYEKPNHQLCFKNQETMDKYLHFARSEKL